MEKTRAILAAAALQREKAAKILMMSSTSMSSAAVDAAASAPDVTNCFSTLRHVKVPEYIMKFEDVATSNLQLRVQIAALEAQLAESQANKDRLTEAIEWGEELCEFHNHSFELVSILGQNQGLTPEAIKILQLLLNDSANDNALLYQLLTGQLDKKLLRAFCLEQTTVLQSLKGIIEGMKDVKGISSELIVSIMKIHDEIEMKNAWKELHETPADDADAADDDDDDDDADDADAKENLRLLLDRVIKCLPTDNLPEDMLLQALVAYQQSLGEIDDEEEVATAPAAAAVEASTVEASAAVASAAVEASPAVASAVVASQRFEAKVALPPVFTKASTLNPKGFAALSKYLGPRLKDVRFTVSTGVVTISADTQEILDAAVKIVQELPRPVTGKTYQGCINVTEKGTFVKVPEFFIDGLLNKPPSNLTDKSDINVRLSRTSEKGILWELVAGNAGDAAAP
jgi:hypothetical protein